MTDTSVLRSEALRCRLAAKKAANAFMALRGALAGLAGCDELRDGIRECMDASGHMAQMLAEPEERPFDEDEARDELSVARGGC